MPIPRRRLSPHYFPTPSPDATGTSFMTNKTQQGHSRREFLQTTGKVAAATALAGVIVPHVHAAEDNTINVALIGCGGRGTGAAKNALSVTNAPVKMVAMADVFSHRLEASYNGLKPQFEDKIDVPDDRKFIGFDGYQKAMDCLKPGTSRSSPRRRLSVGSTLAMPSRRT